MPTLLQQFQIIYQYTFQQEEIKHTKIVTFAKDEPILTVGHTIKGLYFLLEGVYYVTSPEVNGKELLLRRCTAPSILGDIEIFQQCTVQSNCIALETCTFLFIPLKAYEDVLRYDANFTHLLLKELSFKLKTCTTLSRVNALSSVSVKLAAYFCSIKDEKNSYLIVENIHHIAHLIGTTPRHINRVLKNWVEEGIIERDGDTLNVLNAEALAFIAENIRYE